MMPHTITTLPLRDRSVESMRHSSDSAAAKPAVKPSNVAGASKVATATSAKVSAAAPTASASK